ncbi:AGE family epimerase/isomerase [Escherichia coli]|nr:AGE family epimerase/isomerase [Escherichia coli]
MIIHDVARNNHYRVNEHFDTQWNPLPDYNKDNPAHRFRAFGGYTRPLDRMGPFNAAHPCCHWKPVANNHQHGC